MRPNRIILATFLVFALLNAGCLKDVVREMSKHVSEMSALHQELVRKFGDNVFVSINEGGGRTVLSVTYINSALNDKSKEDRQARAQETANIVKFRYPAINAVNAIWVVFVREKKTLIFISERQSVDYFGFYKDGTPASNSYASGTTSSGVELTTATNYIPSDNETDISVSGIQLEGTPGVKGLTVLPHFRVTGDVRAAKGPPPAVVSFDFASYSDRKEFEANTPIVFTADGKTEYKTTGSLTTSNISGAVNQFLYLSVPYSAFRKMIHARELTIKLGGKVYPLTPSQFATLKQMDEYVVDEFVTDKPATN